MYRRYLRHYWLPVWGAITVVLLAAALIITVSERSSYSSATQAAQTRAVFYQEIAGYGSTNGNQPVVDQMAQDLRSKLGPLNASASQLPAAIESFNGDPNQYGGISSAIGQNPFAHAASCFECGPLTSSFKGKLLKIKRGQVNSLISAETPKKQSSTAWWILALVALLLGPLYWLRSHVDSDRRLKRDFPDECRLIAQIDDALASLPANDQQQHEELLASRAKLVAITRGNQSLYAQNVIQQAQLQLTARQAADKELAS